MSFFSKIFSRDNPNVKMQPLYNAIVSEGRQLGWYEEAQVPDSIDGRFDMIAAIFSLILIRLEKDEERGQDIAWLTEIFISDMDGRLRGPERRRPANRQDSGHAESPSAWRATVGVKKQSFPFGKF